ncbi:reverse transcriptase-like protein [Aerococcus tenax]|uniref:reverse transcriptase-like protein n=1 Tax=Aerococcus tenax TaxID=3078812 RepID=UPI001E60B3DF|nr:reverse transcriptase-like protein [Aerococcus tenax]
MIRLTIDASVDVETGNAGIGCVWLEEGEQFQLKHALKDKMDNHLAEFYALHYALAALLKKGKENELILCQSDSRIVVDSVHKRYHKREPYKTLLKACLKQVDQFANFNLVWIPESQSKGADRLARQAMRQARDSK